MPPTDRLVGLDVARGAAVLALIFVNISAFASAEFYSDLLGIERSLDNAGTAWEILVGTLLLGKASLLLAFLLGAGLALQEDRVRRTAGCFSRLVLRRMFVLFLIGVAHIVFLWWGDILCGYAVIGVGVLLFRNLGPTGRRILAGVLMSGSVLGFAALGLLPGGDDPESDEWAAGAIKTITQAYSTGGFGAIVRIRLLEAIFFQAILIAMIPWYFGAALLGYDSIRTAWFPAATARFGASFWLVGTLALIASAASTWAGLRLGSTSAESWVVPLLVGLPAALGLSWCYLVGLIHLSNVGRKSSLAFADVGRTALSNYLLQSALAGFFFYGYGLGYFGTLNLTGVVGVALAICTVQLIWPRWWLRRFRFGPVEWLWRVGTYGRRALRPGK